MSPMDIAWRLLKMPIVPNSLKQREGGYTGQFYDPIDDENTPLYLHGDFDEETITGSIPKRARTDATPLHSDTWMADNTEADPHYQRRGYTTALYDALAAVLNERDAKLYPNPIQSEEGEALWGDKESWPVRDDIFETGEPMDIAMRLLKFQTTLPQFDPELSEETGYVGVPPVQQWHSAELPDAMKFMSGTQDPHQSMWTEEEAEKARRWGRGMTQGGPGGALVGVRGESPRGERTSPDWSNQPATELDALTIPGAELSPQDIVMQPLPTPPPAQQWRDAHTPEQLSSEKDRQQAAFDYHRQINYDPNFSDEEKDAVLEDISDKLGPRQITDDPAFRYNPTTNAWEEDV